MINEQDEKIERLSSNNASDMIVSGRDSIIKTFSSKEMRQGMIDATLSSVFYSLNTIVIKQAKEFSPEKFTSFNFALWRGFTSSIALYLSMKRQDSTFNPFANITKPYWLILRSVGFYVGWMFFITSIVLLRVSIAQVMGSIAPVFSLVVSVIVLHEKFYLRYIMGILLCFVGSSIIVLAEKGNNTETALDPFLFYVGILAAIMNIILNGSVIVAQKVLMDVGMPNKQQVFFVSLALFCCSMIMCTLTWNFGFDPYIMGLATLNGGFFYYANHYANESLKVLNVGGTVPFNYLQTIFVFIMCVIILRESIFMIDIIGSIVIVSFHGYNSWSPIN